MRPLNNNGVLIREEMDARRLSQARLAEMACVTPSELSNVLRGDGRYHDHVLLRVGLALEADLSCFEFHFKPKFTLKEWDAVVNKQ